MSDKIPDITWNSEESTATSGGNFKIDIESIEEAIKILDEVEASNPYKKFVEELGFELPENWMLVFPKKFDHEIPCQYRDRVNIDKFGFVQNIIICDVSYKSKIYF